MRLARVGALVALAGAVLLLWPGSLEPAEEPSNGLLALYRKRDYFELRKRLGGIPDATPSGSAELRFLAAAVQHAFNRPAASNRTLIALATGSELPAELAREARRLRMANHIRRYEYAQALSVARESLRDPAVARSPRAQSDVRNTALLLSALADVPPQGVVIGKRSRLSLRLDRRVPVEIGGEQLRLSIDTGANFSVLMRSEAERVGLAIRKTALQVDTATGKKVGADVAVANRVGLGNA